MIENKFQEFKYILEEEKFKCEVCDKGVATYEAFLEDDFTGKVQSQKFRNVKRTLKVHLGSDGHQGVLKEAEAQKKLHEKIISREKKIGRVLGSVAYYLLKLGRPNLDFPILVNILASAGVDVGDINHSSEFVPHWGAVCATEIEGKIKSYLNTALVQTGHRPPVKGVADKATWQHYTRMISGLVTVVPDSPCFLQAFLTGTELCPHGSGIDMANSLIKVWDSFIIRSQVLARIRSIYKLIHLFCIVLWSQSRWCNFALQCAKGAGHALSEKRT